MNELTIITLILLLSLVSCGDFTQKAKSTNEESVLQEKVTEINNSEYLQEKKPFDSEKDSYSKSDLIGKWWTPHFAVRKIEFFDNNRFKFNDGNDNISDGNFTLSKRTVTLSFDSNEQNVVMKLGGGNNDYSYTLVGNGENFVNER